MKWLQYGVAGVNYLNMKELSKIRNSATPDIHGLYTGKCYVLLWGCRVAAKTKKSGLL